MDDDAQLVCGTDDLVAAVYRGLPTALLWLVSLSLGMSAGAGKLGSNLAGGDGHDDGFGVVDLASRYSLVFGHAKVVHHSRFAAECHSGREVEEHGGGRVEAVPVAS